MNSKSQTFEQFLANQVSQIDIIQFVINLLITLMLGVILAYLYEHYGTSISQRKRFANNLIIISMTTMLIITIVKSSLALSLGLVGALSIVRFRTAIKEPEELCYLFLSIAVGLGLGAGQKTIVVVGFALIACSILVIRKRFSSDYQNGIHLTLNLDNAPGKVLESIVRILEQNALAVKLIRVDESAAGFSGDFLLRFNSFNELDKTKNELQDLYQDISLSYIDSEVLR